MKLLGYVILFALAAWIGVLLRQAPGDLLLVWQDWSIELPMWLAIAGSLFAIFCILTLVRIIHNIFSSYDNGKRYFKTAKLKSAREYTTQALLQLAQDQWEQAEKNAIKGATYSELPFLNYVSAAKAAQEQHAWDRRDQYLALAAENVPNARFAAGIIKAKLQYKQGEFSQSLATLQELRKDSPKHPLVLRLLAEVYASNKNWSSLLQILPVLKRKDCEPELLTELSVKAYQGLLVEKMQAGSEQGLIKFWRSLSRDMRCNTNLVETYVGCLSKLTAYKEAFETLKAALKKNWDKKLVHLYGVVHGPDLSKQIFVAENWLQDHPGDPTLLLSLARLCVQHKLWGKARDYLEVSIQLAPTPESYAELGDLFKLLGNPEKSLDCYRKGLLEATTSSGLSLLPVV